MSDDHNGERHERRDRYEARTYRNERWDVGIWDRKRSRWIRTGLAAWDAERIANRMNRSRIDWTYRND